MLKGLSLFASAGVGETYIHEHICVANELLEDRARFYSHFSPHTTMIQGDITNPEIFAQIERECILQQVNFIIATPPCQSFSKAGQMREDERSYLFMYVIRMIQSLNPLYVFIENVVEFMTASITYENTTTSIQKIINRLSDTYDIQWHIINAKNYDTPQDRKRCIVLFSRKDQKVWTLPPTHAIRTVEQTIGHLPSLVNNEHSSKWHYAKKHNDRHVEWMSHTPTGKTAFDNSEHFPQKDGRRIKGFKTTYKRIRWDAPAPTITMANGSISSQNNVHPGRLLENGLYSDPRVLSVLEVMLLTGLREDWNIPEWASETFIRAILGECVQPNLMLHFISHLLEINN